MLDNDYEDSRVTVLTDKLMAAQDKVRRYEIVIDHIVGLL